MAANSWAGYGLRSKVFILGETGSPGLCSAGYIWMIRPPSSGAQALRYVGISVMLSWSTKHLI